MSPLVRQAVLGLVATGCAFMLFRGATEGTRRAPEDAIPAASFLVASIDLDALRASPVTAPLVAPASSRALGASSLEEACGFDPLARVHHAAAAVPEEASERGTFGVAARVDVSRSELLRCAEGLARERPQTPVRERGRFHVLGGTDTPGLAIDDAGLLVVSKGPWLDAMVDAANDPRTRLTSASEHMRLRASLTGDPQMRSPALLVTLLLPGSVRDRIRAEMSAGDADTSGMGGVLGVGSAGLALALPPASRPGPVVAHAELGCDDEASAKALVALLERKRFELGKSMPLRLMGLGAVVDGITIDAAGTKVHVRATADGDALAQLTSRLAPHAPPPSRPSRP